MALTRRFLKELGIEAEAVDKILEEHGKTFDGMITKSQAEDDQKKAIEDAKKVWDAEPKKINVKETEEYKELDKKYSDLLIDTKLTQNKVRDKYRAFVREKLPTDKPFEEGIKAVQGEFPEFFEEEEKKDEDEGKKDKPKPKLGGGASDPKKDNPSDTEEESVKKAFLSAFKR